MSVGPTPPDQVSGRASYFILDGTRIPFKKYTPKTTRKLSDTTDSENYDPVTDMLYPSQVPVSIGLELTVDGVFRRATTPARLMGLLFSGAAAVPVVLGLDAGLLYGTGNFDISDFSTDVPIDDMVGWSATFQLNGKFTVGGTPPAP